MRRFTVMIGRGSGLVGAAGCTGLSYSPAVQILKHELHSMYASRVQYIYTMNVDVMIHQRKLMSTVAGARAVTYR